MSRGSGLVGGAADGGLHLRPPRQLCCMDQAYGPNSQSVSGLADPDVARLS
jgi:hypothetical protein